LKPKPKPLRRKLQRKPIPNPRQKILLHEQEVQAEDNSYVRSRLIQAADKFNTGDFFECHEILEDVWFDVRDRSRDFYQGLLHIAVGFYHLTKKKNPKGTILQLDKAILKLEPYGKEFSGIETEKLLKQIKRIKDKLKKGGIPKGLPKIVIE
jgi:predicted metal-dependent hydrolase